MKLGVNRQELWCNFVLFWKNGGCGSYERLILFFFLFTCHLSVLKYSIHWKMSYNTGEWPYTDILSKAKQNLYNWRKCLLTYGRYQHLVDRYEISVLKTIDMLLFTWMFSFLYQCKDCYRSWLFLWVTRRCLIRREICLPFASTRVHCRFFVRVVLLMI